MLEGSHPLGNASIIADARTSKENEDTIGGPQNQYRLQCRLVGEQRRLRIRQNSRQEVPDRNCERDPGDECDDPGRDIEASGCGRHVGVCGECSDWHIGKKIADAHQAKPELEYRQKPDESCSWRIADETLSKRADLQESYLLAT